MWVGLESTAAWHTSSQVLQVLQSPQTQLCQGGPSLPEHHVRGRGIRRSNPLDFQLHLGVNVLVLRASAGWSLARHGGGLSDTQFALGGTIILRRKRSTTPLPVRLVTGLTWIH